MHASVDEFIARLWNYTSQTEQPIVFNCKYAAVNVLLTSLAHDAYALGSNNVEVEIQSSSPPNSLGLEHLLKYQISIAFQIDSI